MNKALKLYLKDIKKTFPFYKEEEKKYFESFQNTVISEASDDITYLECIDTFGSPKEIISSYLENIESETLLNKMKKRYLLNNLTSLIIVFIIASSLLSGVLIWKNYQEQRSHIDKYEEDIITVYE